MRQLKLIWDFRGSVAKETAKHHLIHLNEYITLNKSEIITTGIEHLTEMHSIAFIAVNEEFMKPLRDALKPHRGELYLP